MGKLAAFGIKFASENAVFFPGSVVSGDLFLELREPMQMKAVVLKFIGHARVHWTESHSTGSGKNRRTETRHYSADQRLFEQKIIIYGQGTVENRDSLPQGNHVFPFNFQLPMQLPSSYEDHIGYIRYHVKGTIVKPWKFDHNTKRVFTVLDTLDLNIQPNVMVPAGASETKTLCCCCCRSGPIEVEFNSDRSGYVPGEYIRINATLTNMSNSNVLRTSVHLRKEVKYHATTKTRTQSEIVATVEGQGCAKRSTVTWNNAMLHIPPLPPSESTHCRIIDINYFITFEGHLRTCAVNLRQSAPIIIGTIPLRNLEMYHNMPEPSAVPSMASAPLMDNVPSSSGATGEGPPPPSYAAVVGEAFAVKDDDDNEYTMGDTTYAPQYTYYDWKKSAFTLHLF